MTAQTVSFNRAAGPEVDGKRFVQDALRNPISRSDLFTKSGIALKKPYWKHRTG